MFSFCVCCWYRGREEHGEVRESPIHHCRKRKLLIWYGKLLVPGYVEHTLNNVVKHIQHVGLITARLFVHPPIVHLAFCISFSMTVALCKLGYHAMRVGVFVCKHATHGNTSVIHFSDHIYCMKKWRWEPSSVN